VCCLHTHTHMHTQDRCNWVDSSSFYCDVSTCMHAKTHTNTHTQTHTHAHKDIHTHTTIMYPTRAHTRAHAHTHTHTHTHSPLWVRIHVDWRSRDDRRDRWSLATTKVMHSYTCRLTLERWQTRQMIDATDARPHTSSLMRPHTWTLAATKDMHSSTWQSQNIQVAVRIAFDSLHQVFASSALE